MQHLGIGLPGQDLLDLGSGTGALAIPFAKQGAHVTAVDLSEGQIQAGRQSAHRQGASLIFKVAPAEATGLPNHSFDVITASMCSGYFDILRMGAEVPRLLRVNSLLLISSLIWIAGKDAIASRTESLLAKHNGKSGRGGCDRNAEIVPAWSRIRFRLQTHHEFKVDLSFTREGWRGRLRASKWVGAVLTPERTEAFGDLTGLGFAHKQPPTEWRNKHKMRERRPHCGLRRKPS